MTDEENIADIRRRLAAVEEQNIEEATTLLALVERKIAEMTALRITKTDPLELELLDRHIGRFQRLQYTFKSLRDEATAIRQILILGSKPGTA